MSRSPPGPMFPVQQQAAAAQPTKKRAPPSRSQGSQIVENDKKRRHQRFQQEDEKKVSCGFGKKERVSRRRGDPVSVKHLVANFARPSLIQRYHRSEQKCHPNQSSSDAARFLR